MVGSRSAYIIFFDSLKKDDIPLVGGKCANLGELLSFGVPVPPGFAITAEAYKLHINRNNLWDRIKDVLSRMDVADSDSLESSSREIRSIIESAPLPAELADEIVAAYQRLGNMLKVKDPPVAVRSSATAEDLPGASFAGQQDTYLFVSGKDPLLKYVVKCFSSLFTPRAIAYRKEKGFDDMKVYLSVAVQKMVNSESSGVMFTLDPTTGNRDVVLIEGTWGIGEMIVQGKVSPDEWTVDKKTMTIIERNISKKVMMAIRSPSDSGEGFLREIPVSQERIEAPCISDDQVLELAKFAVEIEKHYGMAMDIEWALDSEDKKLYIVQARPETVWSMKQVTAPEGKKMDQMDSGVKRLLRGVPASPGLVSGKAHVIMDTKHIREFQAGEILVTEMTSPDWAPAMRKALAIITDSGGKTCHAAIVSRELGIPCIVGTKEATKILKTGQVITVDATHGVVYEGDLIGPEEKKPVIPTKAALSVESYYPTATKIYMNLGEPGMIDKYRDLPFDGIGLMRVEFIIADVIGEHPLHLIETKQEEKFIDKLATGISKVAREIHPRPLVVRFSDFKTNEYRQLVGGERFEPQEANPMIGWRGVSRYVSDVYSPAFRLECRAIKRVRDEWGLKNVWVMLPFVRTTWEVESCLNIMKEEGLQRDRDFKVWLMAEIPSIIFMADEFSRLCDGFSVGSNDLTQLILGVDRDSPILPAQDSRYFDERDPAVIRAITHLIKVAHSHGVTVSICGQGPSVYPDLTETLVRAGIDSISANPDMVVWTRKVVAGVERKVLMERLVKSSKNNGFELLE
ncbi:MAG: phosphoenolpyruvate synthase [Candidatus Methanosuratus sp.]|nr:phosphoenolpyruvate synthase [Candidatus Methanosuratincola sp.]